MSKQPKDVPAPQEQPPAAKQPGQGTPLVSKLGHCERCGFHFVLMCSLNDTSAPCPLCENAVELTQV